MCNFFFIFCFVFFFFIFCFLFYFCFLFLFFVSFLFFYFLFSFYFCFYFLLKTTLLAEIIIKGRRVPDGKDSDRHYKICGCTIRRFYYNGGSVDELTCAIPVLVYLELDSLASQVSEDLALHKMDRIFLKENFREIGRSRIDRKPFDWFVLCV